MNFQKFKDWVFIGIVGSGLSAAVAILWLINLNMAELNSKLAVVISEQKGIVKTVDDHETRIRNLERIK